MLRLLAFRARDFRSIDDSGWIETDQVTALIGTNESGKTNAVMPLWKLKPAKGGDIDALADYPRKRYHEIRAMKRKPVFIEARFELPLATRKKVAELLSVSEDRAAEATVSRDFDGHYYVGFQRAGQGPTVQRDALLHELHTAASEIAAAKIGEAEEALRHAIEQAINNAAGLIDEAPGKEIEPPVLADIETSFANVDVTQAPPHSVIAARFGQLVDTVTGFSTKVTEAQRQEARNLVVKELPSFVYYSNYGNLDSEIYLPHVIDNLKRAGLGQKEQAKTRTLKVLFDFVKLSPEEILKLGEDVTIPAGTLTPEQGAQITSIAQKKKERDVLLQSASTQLTRRFREWWKQGEYRFRFAADGNHFRIWVSDDLRPEDIELEARSTGLQWFFSFYLVFLVESEDSHEGAILLLDEPGLSLHPLAQTDLSAFFDGLAATNQLIYTTHSPFMVDADHLDRARAVYTDKTGVTRVSPDLRAPIDKSDQSKSIYAAWAALGMSVSDTMLAGCQAVIVEGPSDQHYLSAVKNYLIGKGHLQPSRDIIFLPSGGVKGTKAVCALIMGKDDELPFVILDSDEQGARFAEGLKTSLYVKAKERVTAIGGLVKVLNAEIEDLFPPKLIARVVDRYLPKPSGLDADFIDTLKDGEPIVAQIEHYAQSSGIVLEDGWKVEVAKRVKSAILRAKDDPLEKENSYLETWRQLFALIHPQPRSVGA